MRNAQDIRNEIGQLDTRLNTLLGELGQISLADENSPGFIHVMGSTYYLVREENEYYQDMGYEVGEWIPSSSTC